MAGHSIQARLLRPGDLTAEDQERWARIVSTQPIAFLSFAYVRAIAAVMPHVRVCRFQDDAGRVAFFAFQYRSKAHGIFGIGERLGGEMSDYFGVAAEPGFSIDPSRLLRLSGLRSLSFTHLEEGQSAFGLAGDQTEIGHCIQIPSGGDAFWSQKRQEDKKFVQDTERRERKLSEQHGALAFTFQSDEPAEAASEIIRRKRDQYQRTGVKDVLAQDDTQKALQVLSRCRDPQCTGVASTLYAGSTWVASHFGLRCQERLHYWFPVYNPEMKSFAPGRLLLKQIIDRAEGLGLTIIDRGAGDSQAKRDLATTSHNFYSGLWQRNDIVAVSHRVGLALHWRLDKFLRQRAANAGRGLSEG